MMQGSSIRVHGARWLSWMTLLAACFGLVLLTRLPLRLYQVLVAWGSTLLRNQVPYVITSVAAEPYAAVIAPLEMGLAAYAWLWPLLGAVGLLLAGHDYGHGRLRLSRWKLLALAALLFVAFLAGAQTRLSPLVERESALSWTMDYDEGVYVGFAREWANGNLPYRDLWVSHPPTGIALLVPAVVASPSGEDALINARRFTAALDLIAALLLIWVGTQLANPAVGVLAAGVYLLDLLAGRNSSHVWLETSLNLWSVAALGCLLCGMRHNRLGWFVAAGLFAVFAATTKYTGAALGIAAMSTLMLAARWRWTGAFILGGALATGCYALLVLPFGWREVVQQTLLAQLLRPADDILPAIRLDAALHTPASLLTTVGGALGACWVLLRRPALRLGWALVLVWLAVALALLVNSPTFYDHYATQLVAPLAILAGGVAVAVPHSLNRTRVAPAAQLLWKRTGWLLPLGLGLLVVPLLGTRQFDQQLVQRSDDVIANSRVVRERVPVGQPVITFEPLYNLLADRPFARAPDGRLLIDSYMQLRFSQIDWAALTLPQTFAYIWLRGELPQQPWPNAGALMLEQGPWALFDAVRQPRTKAEVIALAGNYRALTLPGGTLYKRTQTPRRFVAESVQLRGLLVPTTARAGISLPVAMFWQKPLPEQRAPVVSLQLIGTNGEKVGQYDKPVGPAEAGLQAWPVGPNTYQDDIAIPIAPNAPPGEYTLLMVVYDPALGQRWPLVSDQGQPIGESLAIDTVRISAATSR